ncbi:hypothetical protein ACQKQD_12900 [Methylobacterium sp. NPDC080182]
MPERYLGAFVQITTIRGARIKTRIMRRFEDQCELWQTSAEELFRAIE